MTSTDRRRFPAIAALALTGAVLASLLSTAEAQTERTNFYLWRTTLTVGEDSGTLGYDKDASLGSISTDADFGYPPWNPPHKHHVDRESYVTVESITLSENPNSGITQLRLKVSQLPHTGKVTLWIGRKHFPFAHETYSLRSCQ